MSIYKKAQISIIIILGFILAISFFSTKNLNFSERNIVNKNSKISQYNVLYSENFDDGIADSWTTLGGNWTIENNQYKVTGTPSERVRSYYTAEIFSYYNYEGDFKLISGNEIQVIFNIHDIFYGADQGHYCQISLFYEDPMGRKDTAILYSTQNGQIEHKRVSYNFNYNQWYHFSVISSRNSVEFFLNNSLILSYSGVFYYSGYIGVKSMYGPIAYWDNILVTEFNNSGKIYINGNSGWADFKNAGNCTGEGTYSNPYVIEDLVINAGGSGNCLLIENSNVFFRVENCTMINSGIGHTGVILNNVSNGQLINTTINGHAYGITLDNSNNNTLIGNSACYNNNDGMLISNSNNNIFLDNNIENNNAIGLRLGFCNNNTVTENSINNNWEGIYLSKSNENNILGNNISYNDKGIKLYDSFNCNISGNTANYNQIGIYLALSDNTVISGNTVNNNYIYGIDLSSYSNDNTIIGNTANYNGYRGITLTHSDNNNVSENTINFNLIGIFLYDNHNNLILRNEINGNSQYGICLSYSDYNVIKFNQITNNYIGIYLFYSNSNEILNNTFNGNYIDTKEYIVTEYPYPYENTIISLSVIIAVIILIAVLAKRKHVRPKPFRIKKPREEFQIIKEPIRKRNLESRREKELLIRSEVEPISELQKDKGITTEIEEKRIISAPHLVKDEEEIEIKPSTVSKPKIKEEEIIQGERPSRFCTNCGKSLNPNWNACPYCGLKIKKDVERIKLVFSEKIIQMEKKEEISKLKPSETPEVKEKRESLKSMKNFCPFCGYENQLNNVYCLQCGYKFKNQ